MRTLWVLACLVTLTSVQTSFAEFRSPTPHVRKSTRGRHRVGIRRYSITHASDPIRLSGTRGIALTLSVTDRARSRSQRVTLRTSESGRRGPVARIQTEVLAGRRSPAILGELNGMLRAAGASHLEGTGARTAIVEPSARSRPPGWSPGAVWIVSRADGPLHAFNAEVARPRQHQVEVRVRQGRAASVSREVARDVAAFYAGQPEVRRIRVGQHTFEVAFKGTGSETLVQRPTPPRPRTSGPGETNIRLRRPSRLVHVGTFAQWAVAERMEPDGPTISLKLAEVSLAELAPRLPRDPAPRFLRAVFRDDGGRIVRDGALREGEQVTRMRIRRRMGASIVTRDRTTDGVLVVSLDDIARGGSAHLDWVYRAPGVPPQRVEMKYDRASHTLSLHAHRSDASEEVLAQALHAASAALSARRGLPSQLLVTDRSGAHSYRNLSVVPSSPAARRAASQSPR